MPQTFRSPPGPHASAAILAWSMLWAGMVVGVSLIATPVKFTAPTLAIGPALDVGQVTFGLFTRIEWGLAGVSLLIVAWARFAPFAIVTNLVLVSILAIQSGWLLPVLNERVAAVLAGAPLPASSHHAAYALLEAAKLCCLFLYGGYAWIRTAARRYR